MRLFDKLRKKREDTQTQKRSELQTLWSIDRFKGDLNAYKEWKVENDDLFTGVERLVVMDTRRSAKWVVDPIYTSRNYIGPILDMDYESEKLFVLELIEKGCIALIDFDYTYSRSQGGIYHVATGTPVMVKTLEGLPYRAQISE